MKINKGPRGQVHLGECTPGMCVEWNNKFYIITCSELLCERMNTQCVGINLENGDYISNRDVLVAPVDAEVTILS